MIYQFKIQVTVLYLVRAMSHTRQPHQASVHVESTCTMRQGNKRVGLHGSDATARKNGFDINATQKQG
jgi:hypothetical protein